jgi:hypothetical protein
MSQPSDPFEFLKSLWAPMGLPMTGMIAPTLDLNEIEKRIAELKLVENWLNMNLGALRMTIQGLEMQRSTLAAMQGAMAEAVKAAAEAQPGAADAGRSLAEAWLKMLQPQEPQSATERAATAQPAPEPEKK